MSIFDILKGDKPLLRPTMKQRISTVEQDYARLLSTTGAHDVRNPYPRSYSNLVSEGSKGYYVRDCGDPGLASIEPTVGTVHPDAVSALMTDRAGSANDHQFITIVPPNPGVAIADYGPIVCPPDTTFIMCVACANIHNNDSLCLHLEPLGKVYNSNSIIPEGWERWFPFATTLTTNGGKINSWIKFKKPIKQFWLDIGREAGGGGPGTFTLLMANDIDFSFMKGAQ